MATASLSGKVIEGGRVKIGVVAAVLMVGAIAATRPKIGPAIERTRPYIGDWWRTGELPFGGPAPS